MIQLFFLIFFALVATFGLSRFVTPILLRNVPIPVGIFQTINIALPIVYFAFSFGPLYYFFTWYNEHEAPLNALEQIEQIHSSVEVTLTSVNGRVVGIDKLSGERGVQPSQIRDSVQSAVTELDGALQHLKESSSAIIRNSSLFEEGAITFDHKMIQRWKKLKEDQAHMSTRAEELRKKLVSIPIPTTLATARPTTTTTTTTTTSPTTTTTQPIIASYTHPSPVPMQRDDIRKSTMKSFIMQYCKANEDKDIDKVLSFYGQNVDYLGHGMVSKSRIHQDKSDFFRFRSLSYIYGDDLTIDELSPNTIRLTFSWKFIMDGRAYSARKNVWDIENPGSSPRIIREKQTNL